MEISSILFPWDQMPKTSDQGTLLEQAFQLNACTMALKSIICVEEFADAYTLLHFHIPYRKVCTTFSTETNGSRNQNNCFHREVFNDLVTIFPISSVL